MTEHEVEVLRAKTFLKAAVPLLEEVVAADPAKQKMIAKWNAVVQFKVQNEEPAGYIQFQNGECKVIQGVHEKPTITLGFKNLKHFNDTMAGNKAPMPKISGIWHLILLLKVQGLLDSLQMLKPDYVVKTEEMKKLKVQMLLLMVTRALQQMSKGGDEYVKRLTKAQRKKVIEWTVAQQDDMPAAFMQIDMGKIKAGKGRSKRRPYLAMDFKDIDSAMKVLTGEVGAVEAQMQGLVVPRGTAEFGMKVGSLMKRVENFLMPKEGAADEPVADN
ncbi:SCP2 sterol-binding domain-containing protein [bacterium]